MLRRISFAALLSLALVSPVMAQTGGNLGPVAPGVAATKSTMMGGQYNAVLPTFTTGQQGALQLDASGRLVVSVGARTDSRPASGTITVQDTGSASASGQDSVSIITGSPTASSTQSVAVNGQGTIGVQLSGTWTGTLTTEQSRDGGTTWETMPCHVNGAVYSRTAFTGNGMFNCIAASATNVRARATAAMTGTATVLFTASSAPGYHEIINSVSLKDNLSGVQASIKAASTAPTTSDTPLVIVESPNRFGLTPVTTGALAANQIIKASAGNLYGFQVSADSTLSGAAWWIMVYDATSAPVDGAVTPKKCYAQPSGTTGASYAWPVPIAFATGIVVGVSTTGCFTKTASTHAFISGDAQ